MDDSLDLPDFPTAKRSCYMVILNFLPLKGEPWTGTVYRAGCPYNRTIAIVLVWIGFKPSVFSLHSAMMLAMFQIM